MDFSQWGGRRFYLFSSFLKKHFPFKVGKIPIYAGFTCPNIDGTKGRGGCIYCNNKSFSPAVSDSVLSVREQIQRAKEQAARSKKSPRKFLAYFQAYTNTYAPLEKLRALYEEALADEDVVGLDIGTRPDCISEEILSMLESFTDRYMVWLEYGLQSASNRTLKKINRGHTVEDFIQAVEMSKGRGIYLCGHVILGFPWETKEEMLRSVQLISDLEMDGIKIHHLYIAKDTPMERGYRKGKFPVMSFEEYLPLLCDALEILSPSITIHRLTGDLFGEYLVAPHFGLSMSQIYDRVQKELERRGTYQGFAYRPHSLVGKKQ